jgi:protein O-mannosyl-transferase
VTDSAGGRKRRQKGGSPEGRGAARRVEARRKRSAVTVANHEEEPRIPPRALIVGLAISLVAVTVILYLPVRNYPFIGFDDPGYVTENPRVTGGLTWGSIRWALTSGYFANWHPLTWISHMVDVQLFGMNGGAHHVTNLVLHVANTLLLFVVLFKMTGAVGRSAFVAALFAVHPMHVESVAWVSERKDVLSTAFWLLTMWAYLVYTRKPQFPRYTLVLVLFALGLMSKPMLVTLPCALLLLDVWPLRRAVIGQSPRSVWLRLVYEKIPLFALAAASSVITYLVQRNSGAVESLNVVPLSVRIANAILAYWMYVQKLVAPRGLGILYPYPSNLFVGTVAAALAAVIAVSVAVALSVRTRPYLLVGWLWFVGTLVPVIGIVQVGKQPMADRYSYIPSIGLFVLVAWGAVDLLHRIRVPRVLSPVLSVITVGVYTAVAQRQLEYWRLSSELWKHTIAVTGENYLAENNLGWDLDREHKPTEAIPHYLEAIRLSPRFTGGHANLALVLAEVGRTDEAIEQFREVLKIEPKNHLAYLHMGFALSREGRSDEALSSFAEAIRLKPDYVEAHNGLGLVLARKGDADGAIREYREALRLMPTFAEAHSNLGAALASQGKLDEAIAQFSEAIRQKPDLVDAHNNLAVALSTQGRLDDAIAQFTEAIRLNPNYANAHSGLALALQRKGRVADATREFKEVLRIRPGDADALRGLQQLGQSPD